MKTIPLPKRRSAFAVLLAADSCGLKVSRNTGAAMNEQERAEFQHLKNLHQLLEAQLKQLGTKVDDLENKLQQKSSDLNKLQPIEIPSLEIPKLETSDPIHAPTPKPITPPILPKILVTSNIREAPPVIPTTNLPESLLQLKARAPSAQPPPLVEPAPPNFTKPDETEKGSFEMRLGTYWFVRAGIVLLLTGMAFFARYAYQN
ncbi:MAG: hypothetical protein ABI042_09325, partial [Verrucomicrobiota bacterium]